MSSVRSGMHFSSTIMGINLSEAPCAVGNIAQANTVNVCRTLKDDAKLTDVQRPHVIAKEVLGAFFRKMPQQCFLLFVQGVRSALSVSSLQSEIRGCSNTSQVVVLYRF